MRCSLPIRMITAVFVMAVSLNAMSEAHDHDHPTPGEIQKAREDGTYDARFARMMRSTPHRLSNGLAERAVYKLRRASLESAGLSVPEMSRQLQGGPQMAFPFTSPRELRPFGTVETLTLLIDFRDHRAAAESNRTVNGLFVSHGRECDIRWSTYFLNDSPKWERRFPVYCVVQINNVFSNPAPNGGTRWVAYPRPQVVFQFYSGLNGDLLFAESITASAK